MTIPLTLHSVGRPGTPDEIAKAVVFPASNDSSYIMRRFVGRRSCSK